MLGVRIKHSVTISSLRHRQGKNKCKRDLQFRLYLPTNRQAKVVLLARQRNRSHDDCQYLPAVRRRLREEGNGTPVVDSLRASSYDETENAELLARERHQHRYLIHLGIPYVFMVVATPAWRIATAVFHSHRRAFRYEHSAYN